jgi:hypothetical protein
MPPEVDYCDRCPARGLVRMVRGLLVFVLCTHHYHAHAAALQADGWTPYPVQNP